MLQMKNSGIEWIGNIPKDWCVNRLKYYLLQNDGGVWGDDPIEDKYNSTVLRSTEQTIDGKWDIKDPAKRFLGFSNNLDYYKIKKDDLLITKSSGSGLHIGKTTLATINEEKNGYFYSNFLQRLHTNKFLSAKFLWYILNNPYSREQFVYMQNSTSGIGNINSINIGDLKIAVPEINTQLAITDILDKKCGEIDGLISDIEKEIEILNQYKKSIITETVTKGLNKNIKLKNSDIEWAKQIPEHWEIIPNKYLMKKVKNICPKYTDEKILSLTMNGVIVRDLDAGGKMPTSFDEYQIVKLGNLLMCLFDIDVTPRCVGLIKDHGLTSPAYSQFVMKEKAYAPYYYYYYLMLDYTKELLHLAKNLRHSFTEEQLGTINTPVPPIQEQKEIAEYLDKKCKEIDSILENKNKQLETLESYKKSIIYEYVTGKKEVK